jgi:hypothetical protein
VTLLWALVAWLSADAAIVVALSIAHDRAPIRPGTYLSPSRREDAWASPRHQGIRETEPCCRSRPRRFEGSSLPLPPRGSREGGTSQRGHQ